jgi:hypothetical protein
MPPHISPGYQCASICIRLMPPSPRSRSCSCHSSLSAHHHVPAGGIYERRQRCKRHCCQDCLVEKSPHTPEPHSRHSATSVSCPLSSTLHAMPIPRSIDPLETPVPYTLHRVPCTVYGVNPVTVRLIHIATPAVSTPQNPERMWYNIDALTLQHPNQVLQQLPRACKPQEDHSEDKGIPRSHCCGCFAKWPPGTPQDLWAGWSGRSAPPGLSPRHVPAPVPLR